jgi:hypothetical protein
MNSVADLGYDWRLNRQELKSSVFPMASGQLIAETLLICSHIALDANNLGLSYWYDLSPNGPKCPNRDKSP